MDAAPKNESRTQIAADAKELARPADLSVIELSPEGRRRFEQLLADPPEGPTEAMKQLGELPPLPERRGPTP